MDLTGEEEVCPESFPQQKSILQKKKNFMSLISAEKHIPPVQPSLEILSQLRWGNETQPTGVRVSKKLIRNAVAKEGSGCGERIWP